MTDTISDIRARRVWDSRGRPTVEVDVRTARGALGRAIAPAGASTGSGEATDLRDGGDRLAGLDVSRAVANVRDLIAPALLGRPVADQAGADAALDALDPSPTRERLGGNATVATSLAVLHAAAAASGVPTWRYLDADVRALPRPQIQIIGGGAHAAQRVDIQDFMVIPLTATTMAACLEQVAEVYLAVGGLLRRRGPALGVADEGGHWPAVDGTRAALGLLTDGIAAAGLTPGVDMAISLDIAATQFYADGRYRLASEGTAFDPDGWLDAVAEWLDAFPIVAIEDPVAEDDAAGMAEITRRLRTRALIVGDDFLVTDPSRVSAATAAGAGSAALIKVNQAGTVTKAAAASAAARGAGWATIVSARSGETEDTSVVDLAVGWAADIVKVGSITRGERTAKWNQLLRVDEELGGVPVAPFRLR